MESQAETRSESDRAEINKLTGAVNDKFNEKKRTLVANVTFHTAQIHQPTTKPLFKRVIEYPFTAHVYYPIFPAMLFLSYYGIMVTYGTLHPSFARVQDVTWAMFATPIFIAALLIYGPSAKALDTSNSQMLVLWDLTLCLVFTMLLWILTIFGFASYIKEFIVPLFKSKRT
jgi:hypothetical protein